MQKARWSTAIAAAALLALPGAASAQSTPQSTTPQNPPAQSQSPATPQQPTASAERPAQVDADAAKAHLSEARNTLSQMASLPEAAKLQGATRTQVSQLISDFNALITTQTDWRSSYAKVDADMSTLLGPDANDQPVGTSGTGTAGATGTTGTAGAPGSPAAGSAAEAGNAQLDPPIRAKLVEFRTHLKAFEKAAGGAEPPASAPATHDASSSAPAGSMPPSAATSSASNPSNPTASPDPTASSSSPSPTGTSGVSASSPAASMSDAQRAQAASQVNAASNAQQELDAISSILSGSKTGALTKAQTTQLKKHVENLRALLAHQGQ